MKRFGFSKICLAVASCLTGSGAWAQSQTAVTAEAVSENVQSYAPDYFTQFAPQTAADMVALLPGFEIRGGGGGGGNDARGFGQASLNILINGRRPSTKSSSARDILGRIPASNVIRIEIVDGATLDIAGLSGQVANIIAKTGELSGSWNYAARFEKGSQPQLGDGGISFSARRGNIEAVGGLNFGQFSFTEDGDETFFDGLGNIIQNRDEKLGFNTQRPSANLNLTLLRDNGDVANLNLSGGLRNRNITIQEEFTDLTDADLSGRSVAENGQDIRSFELGGDYSFDLDGVGRGGRLKLIGLFGTDDSDFTNRFNFEDVASGQSRFLFTRNDTTAEYIARAEYTFQSGNTNDWSLAIEGAVNTLNSETDFLENEISLVQENVELSEDRFQANLSRSWALDDLTNIQTSIGAEYSVISGDVVTITDPGSLVEVTTFDDISESLFRPKGLINISRTLSDDWTLRGQIERRVDQLDFDTYVSGVNLANNTSTSGGQIVPEQVWDSEVEIARQNSTGLSGTAKIFYRIIDNPIDQILFEDGSQGPANLESSAKEYGIEGNLTWVADELLQGLRLSASGTLADSSIEDTITLEERSRGEQQLWEYEVTARWDISNTPYAIEAEVEQGKRNRNIRVDEFTKNTFIRPEFEVSLIHKTLFGMQWTAKLQNIIDFELRRDRFIFDETRNGDLLQREFTKRKRGQRFSIEVTDTF